MSYPLIDEADLFTKLISTLSEFAGRYGRPPASTTILFEPYHECWGIYHSPRQMCSDDSPGDYEIQNAAVGTIPAPDSEYSRAEFEYSFRALGEFLVAVVDEHLRPSTLVLELDYDRVFTFPDKATK